MGLGVRAAFRPVVMVFARLRRLFSRWALFFTDPTTLRAYTTRTAGYTLPIDVQ